MRVLFITHYPRLYGANKSLLQLLLHLQDDYGVTPFVIAATEGEFTAKLAEQNIDYKTIRFYNWLNSRSFLVRKAIKICNVLFFARILFWLKKNKRQFDGIHTNSVATNLGGYLSKKMNIPHIWHVREYGDCDYDLRFTDTKSHVGNYMATHASRILAISKDIKSYYQNYIDPNKSEDKIRAKIQVVYNGIMLQEDFGPKPKTAGVDIAICFVGVLHKNKNQLEMLKAADFLKNHLNNPRFRLYIVGDGHPAYQAKLQAFVKNKKLEQQVVFTGFVSDVNALLQKMDLGVVCSKREAFGRVTVEFMMHKIPVIVSNSGANPEIINSDAVGLVYELGAYRDLAAQIDGMSKSRDKLRAMGQNAYQHAKKHFTSQQNAQQIYNIYEDVFRKQKAFTQSLAYAED